MLHEVSIGIAGREFLALRAMHRTLRARTASEVRAPRQAPDTSCATSSHTGVWEPYGFTLQLDGQRYKILVQTKSSKFNNTELIEKGA